MFSFKNDMSWSGYYTIQTFLLFDIFAKQKINEILARCLPISMLKNRGLNFMIYISLGSFDDVAFD